MELSKEEVKKIANLARLEISEDEVDYYADELSDVLDYVEQLNKVETGKVSPKIQASLLSNSTREDEQRPEPENLRANRVRRLIGAIPFTKDNFAKVKNILNKQG
ncbi:MAG: Asp-tRNA(Asn)/Glu-tRNA(Gln) amidotransferase subunit GatC [Candidatus Spechtbacterales bacterium]|nr:Asp-tRNA(Asn)/Glu-tRNA(Gln) amidotransferase subunit GatC [Candidatus Spechtbacterales bacterium]